MFVQVIRARVTDSAAIEDLWQRWVSDLAPGTKGWLGTTGGLTADGILVLAARFDTEDLAIFNGARPEQRDWWDEASSYIDGPVAVHDCREINLVMEGGSDGAGFVQFMQARVKDPDRMREIEEQAANTFGRFRPDFIGGIRAWHGDEEAVVTAVDYFTSEAEARAGEEREMPADVQAQFDEWFSLLEDMHFWDVPSPWLASPAE